MGDAPAASPLQSRLRVCCLGLQPEQQLQHPLPTSPGTPFIPEVGKGILIKSEKCFWRSSAKFAPPSSVVCQITAVNTALPRYRQRGGPSWRRVRSPRRMLGTRLVASLGSANPCSIIPRDAPGPWLPRKLLANAGAGGRGGQGTVNHLLHRWSSPSQMFTELSAGGDAGRSLFQHARLPVLGCCIRGAKRAVALLINSN